MPRVNPLLSSFNAGEFSPKMSSRVDIGQYPSACETSQNLIALPQGGFARRPGTRYIAEANNSASYTRLLPFQFSVEQAYIIEGGVSATGVQYFRFFSNQAVLSVPDTDAAITNGFFSTNITGWTDLSTGAAAISWVPSQMSLDATGADVAHAEQQVAVGASYFGNEHVLCFTVRGTSTSEVFGGGGSVKLRVGTTSGASNIVSDVSFAPGHHCYSFTVNSGPIYVQFLNDQGRSLSVDNIGFLSNQPLELRSPYGVASLPSVKTAQSADVMYMAKGYSNDSTAIIPVHKLSRKGALSWSVEEVDFFDGPYLDSNTTATTMTPAATTGDFIRITASSTEGINGGFGFRDVTYADNDVGRLIRLVHGSSEPGYGVIVNVVSTTQVDVDIRRDFGATTAVTTWSLGSFSKVTGYPSTVVFHGQRLALAATRSQPQTVFLSQSADLENMRPDSYVSGAVAVEDDDALNFTIAAQEMSGISWMLSQRGLLLGSQSGEWSVKSQGVSLTPTDVSAELVATNGSRPSQPLLINDVLLFIQRAGRRVMDFQYLFERDGFSGRDVTKLAEHATKSGLTEIHYQKQPQPLIWGLRNDGVVALLTYDPAQEVIGWSRLKLGGSFSSGHAVVESIAVIPGDDGGGRTYDSGERDEVWLTVKRTINGATKRYVEVVEGLYDGPVRHDYDTDAAYKAAVLADQVNAFYVDSGLTYSGAATTSITGLDHLEGETVKVWADGAYQEDKVVTSGAITLDLAASLVHVGLGYKHIYKSLKLNYGAAAGTAVGKKKRIHDVTFIMLNSVLFSYGPKYDDLSTLEFREVSDAMDTAVPLFTGERSTSFGGGWLKDARIYLESDAPGPFFLLALAPEMKTNESL